MADRQELIERLKKQLSYASHPPLAQVLSEAADLAEHDAAVLEAFKNAPRWTGGYIAANERDGEYIDTSEIDAALQQADSGEGK